MLEITNLTKKYGSFLAVDNLSLHINPGELFGFVGPNGAGKTTTIRIVCGLLRATSGSITIGGESSIINPQKIKRLIGYVPDFFGVYDNLKVKEYMELYGSMYSLNYNDIVRLTDDLLALVNLSDKKEIYVDTLSRGMKQRLCVARALLHNPKLLILDEPSSGLDPRARVEMKELLKNLHSLGKTIIISSHILSELSEMCTSIGIMDHGQLRAMGPIDDILHQATGGNIITLQLTSDIDAARILLMEYANVNIQSIMENKINIAFNGDDVERCKLISYLINNNVILTGFNTEASNLESIFMKLTEGTRA